MVEWCNKKLYKCFGKHIKKYAVLMSKLLICLMFFAQDKSLQYKIDPNYVQIIEMHQNRIFLDKLGEKMDRCSH